ncbi:MULTISPECIES: S9 family peptidase [unclassified Paludibacterium]|uniref:alpha/beta hydrolase family protein n=1 Tax=unclassified Paludibacterium TaxID=2618429 RepID=UPI001C05A89B|nr:alpha/beta hydrolase [Paludibacterium sp. B53371]BEV70818.1 alpha/beta hydrolase [Paludibacterium sp. THUN1379]
MQADYPSLTHHYGAMACQAGELWLPSRTSPPVVVLLHGGFWRLPWGREQLHPLALDLCRRGFAVWNMGYRRLGEDGGGWPGTFEDVRAGLDALADLVGQGVVLDLHRVLLVGHSAGGHLALWAAARHDGPVRPLAVAGLAPVTDLRRCHEFVREPEVLRTLLGGTPTSQAERYRQASPVDCLPLGVPQLILHGSEDEAVPLVWSQDYVRLALQAGDAAQLTVIEGMDHMRFLDPASEAHQQLCRWLVRISAE